MVLYVDLFRPWLCSRPRMLTNLSVPLSSFVVAVVGWVVVVVVAAVVVVAVVVIA